MIVVPTSMAIAPHLRLELNGTSLTNWACDRGLSVKADIALALLF